MVGWGGLLASGCGEPAPATRWPSGAPPGGRRPSPQAQLLTLADPGRVKAGETVRIACKVVEPDGVALDIPTEIEVTPAAAIVRASSVETVLAPQKAGAYTVRCRTADRSIVEPTGVTVTVDPGAPVHLRTKLSSDQAPVGSPVQVSCAATDAFGNSAPGPDDLALEVDLGLQAKGPVVTGERPGTYQVTCKGHALAASGAALTLVAGPPKAVQAQVQAASLEAGMRLTARCTAADAFGNALEVPTQITLRNAAGATFQPAEAQTPGTLSIQLDTPGAYQVQCATVGASAVASAVQEVRVRVGAPYRWTVQVAEVWKGCHAQHHVLPLIYDVYDRVGNALVEARGEMRAPPEAGLTRDSFGDYTIANEGTFKVTLAPPRDAAPDHIMKAYHWTLTVDSTPPVIRIDSPASGAVLTQGGMGPETLRLVGSAEDASGVVQLSVNGQEVAGTPAARVAINIPQNSRWGLSIIDVTARDACDNDAIFSQAYLRSPSYYPAAMQNDPLATVPSGIAAHLTQPLLDATGPHGEPTPGPRDPATVAHLLEAALQLETLDAMVGEALAASPDTDNDGQLDTVDYAFLGQKRTNKVRGFEVRRTGPLTYSEPKVESLRARDGGWQLVLSFKDLRLPAVLTTYLDLGFSGNPSLSASGTVAVREVRLTLDLDTRWSPAGPQVVRCDHCAHVTVSPGDPRLEIDWGIWERAGLKDFLDSVSARFIDVYRPKLTAYMTQAVESIAPRTFETFLASFSQVRELQLPAPLSRTLRLASHIDAIALHGPLGAGSLDVGVAVQAYPTAVGLPPELHAIGAIRRSDAPPPLAPLAPGQTLAVGLHDDVLNQILWALWYGGAFNIPDGVRMIGTYAPRAKPLLEGSSMAFFASLPPVIMPGVAPGTVEFGIGDWILDAHIDSATFFSGVPPTGDAAGRARRRMHLTASFSATLPGTLSIDPVTHHLHVTTGEPTIHLTLLPRRNPDKAAALSAEVIRVLKGVLPGLLADALRPLPLPRFPLRDLAGVQSDATWGLEDGRLHRPGLEGSVLGGVLRHVQ